jgi:hypothetical protein
MRNEDTHAANAMLFAGWKLLLLVDADRDVLPDEIVECADDFRATCAEWGISLPRLETSL